MACVVQHRPVKDMYPVFNYIKKMVLILKGFVLVLGITAAAMAEAMKLQKMKFMAMNTLQGNGSQNGTESEPDDLNSNTGEGLQKSKAVDSSTYSGIGERRNEWT